MPGTRRKTKRHPALPEKVHGPSGMEKHRLESSESTWQQRWHSGAYTGKRFLSSSGIPVQILDPGSFNQDAGPDFLNALIRLDDELVRGDVEIHRDPSEWYSHKHHLDPRYNQVVLHVVLVAPSPGFATRSEAGREILLITLPSGHEAFAAREWTPRNTSSAITDGKPVCALAAQNITVLCKVLEQYGRERFLSHAARFTELHQTRGWEEILYSGLLDALGYGKNQISFRRLAERLPFSAVCEGWRIAPAEPVKVAEALLFGAAGLVTPSLNLTHGYVRELQQIWIHLNSRLHIKPLPPEIWIFFRLRPYNFPTRRLAAAAVLLDRLQRVSGLHGLAVMAERYRLEPNRGAAAFEQFALIQTSGFWRDHHLLTPATDASGSRTLASLLGKSRSRELTVNVFLPLLWAYARERDDGRLQTLALQLYLLFPGSAVNWITRTMNNKLTGAAMTREQTAVSCQLAVLQQGMIELHKMYCQPGRCDRCLTRQSMVASNSVTK